MAWRGILSLAALTMLAPQPLRAASFDCAQASTRTERMICADAGLSALDEQMAEAFRAAGASARVRSEQRDWLAARNRCADAACIAGSYRARIARLQAAPPPNGPATCRDQLGAARAQQLVQQCIQVSPATRPPCNAANACGLITDEIARGCGMLPDPKPDFCPR